MEGERGREGGSEGWRGEREWKGVRGGGGRGEGGSCESQEWIIFVTW